ncbi:hypothetical protein SAMN02745249_01465 [Atopostipes suicloacalis DSM 15692]|uniref:Uncharacterized protein n=1 Tax=Atopostipes suicloacalis DSM 15692 TaxID=1121025 RepID=A0A1M4XIY6_9LACT|nr:hypothetical protein [Atopostipes suicloacalis]SHE93469.1 hypothetical protein SAMN02745249_01465 [Atopostipes suicloacalis DSM 15692]
MDSNNPNLNPKQEKLVKRLEEIRRKRNMQETQKATPDRTKEKRSLEQQDSQKRNRNKQQRPTRKTKQSSTPSAQKRKQLTQSKKREPSRKSTSYPGQYATTKQSTQSKQQSKNRLIEKLSDGDQLADAIILSEILSKPVALRNRYW